ncbi:MAG: ATP-binding cassette domain-containing protein [Candidatus Mycalebacterium zealandia]|nr:MAG: ATP-binding cassette domain-containing protein [Candidatus Mycalebacterium zealandia]
MNPLIEARELKKEYIQDSQTVMAVDGISLSVKRAETVSISGKSGSGKTTLLNMLGALEMPSGGEVFFKGEKLCAERDAVGFDVRREMGFVFQSHNLLGGFTALENASFPCLICGMKKSESYERAETLLGQVGLGDKFGCFPDELSAGEQQRVAIARALVMEPKVLFADEPTGNLDPKTSGLVAEMIFSAKDRFNTTLVIATHSREFAAMFDRSVVLSEGRLADA